MIVRCIRREPTLPQSVRLGPHYRPGEQEFPVELGSQYVVYGLRLWGSGAWIDIENDVGYLVTVPLCLFEVVDGRVPTIWLLHVDDDGDIALLPEAFHEPFFMSDLADGKTEAWRALAQVKHVVSPEDATDE